MMQWDGDRALQVEENSRSLILVRKDMVVAGEVQVAENTRLTVAIARRGLMALLSNSLDVMQGSVTRVSRTKYNPSRRQEAKPRLPW